MPLHEELRHAIESNETRTHGNCLDFVHAQVSRLTDAWLVWGRVQYAFRLGAQRVVRYVWLRASGPVDALGPWWCVRVLANFLAQLDVRRMAALFERERVSPRVSWRVVPAGQEQV
jgi:hypothetical protein